MGGWRELEGAGFRRKRLSALRGRGDSKEGGLRGSPVSKAGKRGPSREMGSWVGEGTHLS